MAQAEITELVYSPQHGRDMAVNRKIDFDPSKYNTKEAAARGLYAALRKEAARIGQNPDMEVSLFNPERCKEYSGNEQWCVVWEAGPYDWAISMSMEIQGPWGFCEPYYGFDLHFTD